ncbi:MAG: hypothetical protein IKO55_14660, partial [Kiritimatiellae bacterium]|nr:hypothetical protein [Kiritimatiellia bacterium]
RQTPETKQDMRMRHENTRNAFPYFALFLENWRFSLKARYVNRVHSLHFEDYPGGIWLPRPIVLL